MKRLLFFLAVVLCPLLAQGQKGDSKKFKDVFDFDAIKSDQEFYSQAIIQFQILEKIIPKYSIIRHLPPKELTNLPLKRTIERDKSAFDVNNGVATIVLFPNADDTDSHNEINPELYNLGVDRCEYQLPLSLNDLDSGFQFNHYMFKSSNKAALDAFGILKNGYESESIYIVIDYIQFKDNICTGLPKIRYGVGIRSEIRISNWSNKMDIKESSLASLAANAEINSLKVNITVKTIGITGLGSKLNIPNNTSFDVDTYADYQKIIDFIRTFDEKSKDLKETKKLPSGKEAVYPASVDSTIEFKPQLIPVMDEYRTSITQSFKPYYAALEDLEKRLKKLRRAKGKYQKYKEGDTKIDMAMVSIYEEKIASVLDEMKVIKDRKAKLVNANIYNGDLDRYVKLLLVLNHTSDEKIKEVLTDTTQANEIIAIKSNEVNNALGKSEKRIKADYYESEGYDYLFDKNLDKAIEAFQLAEDTNNGHDSAYEIIGYLKTIKKRGGAVDWKIVYKMMYTSYNWKMPRTIKNKFRVLSE